MVLYYRYAKNERVTERFNSKMPTFDWPFSRTLSKAKKGQQAYAKACAVLSGFTPDLFWCSLLYGLYSCAVF